MIPRKGDPENGVAAGNTLREAARRLGVPGVRREQGRLREELGLRTALPRDAVESLALEAGFHRAAFVDPDRLPPLAHRMRQVLRPGIREQGHLRGMEWEWVLDPGSWAGSSALLVCCLSCHRNDPEKLSPPGDPQASIAPFARAHYYRAAVRMLQGVCLRLEQELGIPRASIRLFSNSRIPEKPLLAATGIGAYGRNGCILVPGLGSHFIIAGAVISGVLISGGSRAVPVEADPCGACSRCQAACPTQALAEPYVLRPGRCLQALAGLDGPFP